MTATQAPNVVVLAGPNGAGKSTAGPAILRDTFGITEFVNADSIAVGLSAYDPESSAIEASRILLQRVRQLADSRADFAFETTLASRSFAPWLSHLSSQGYRIHVVFISLPSADVAVRRVADRVRMGGHDVPEDVVRRRYAAGIRNFFTLYQPLANSWRVYDNSRSGGPSLVARGGSQKPVQAVDSSAWQKFLEEEDHAAQEQ